MAIRNTFIMGKTYEADARCAKMVRRNTMSAITRNVNLIKLAG